MEAEDAVDRLIRRADHVHRVFGEEDPAVRAQQQTTEQIVDRRLLGDDLDLPVGLALRERRGQCQLVGGVRGMVRVAEDQPDDDKADEGNNEWKLHGGGCG